MQRHILIADAVATNRIVLKVKLAAAFYEVTQSSSAAEALQMIGRQRPATVVIGTTEDMTPTELCARIKADPATTHTRVVIVAANLLPADRLEALRAGADDVIVPPYDDAVLMARLRSMHRSSETETELRMREGTHRALGLAEPAAGFDAPGYFGLVTGDRRAMAGRIRALRAELPHRIDLMQPRDILHARNGAGGDAPDVFVIVPGADGDETALQILPDLKARLSTRHAGVLVLMHDCARGSAAAALDLGADEVADAQIPVEEIALRTQRLLARKRKADRLRNTVSAGLRAAVTDPLTGLYNRRYAMPHLARIAERAARTRAPFALMVADLDHFKRVNDRYGHAAGDAVLSEVARRLRENMRAVDLVARIGGEEFLIVLPDADKATAQSAAQRLCAAISERAFDIPGHATPIPVTVSIGVTMGQTEAEAAQEQGDPFNPTALLQRADRALYEAKAQGRNQVELSRPAA